MKIQSSRESHRSEKRYSGVYQQQGRMITDADWNELMEIVTELRRQSLGDVVQSGIPRLDGLKVSFNGSLKVGPGHLYAGGTLARLPREYPYDDQADFPDAPDLPAPPHKLYADVWERALTSLEDGAVRDAALHGADTCARTQTMVQIKWCPESIDPEKLEENPACGDAPLTLTLRQSLPISDACDPCAAQELGEDPTHIGNYLFRVEVHDVVRDANGEITQLTLKWSSENGAEQYAYDSAPEAFKVDGWVFERFSDVTERQLGVHFTRDADTFPRRGKLSTEYPKPADANYPFIRRWDGYVLLNHNGGWSIDTDHAVDRHMALSEVVNIGNTHGQVALTANSCTINLDRIELKLELNHTFVAGDYWTAPVREATAADDASKLVLSASPPTGIVHHYLTLGRVEMNGAGPKIADDPANDLTHRRLNFPSLTTLMAVDVGLDNNCEKLYGNAENVQQALDKLCEIEAKDVSYDPTIQGDRWNDITERSDDPVTAPNTVQDALDTLVENLESSDISYTVPATCPNGEAGQRLKDLLGVSGITTKLDDLWDTVLCGLDAGTIPFDNQCPALYQNAATVEDALKNLCAINASAIAFDVPACTTTPSVRSGLGLAAGPATLESVLTKVLCDLNATDVPIEKNADLQPPLNAPGVDTVQDALNALAMSRASGCAVTVGAGGTYATLVEAFDKLAAQDVIVICLLPGTHDLPSPLSPAPHHAIKITGAGGAASVIQLHGSLVLTADEIILHNVGVRSADARAGLTLTAASVTTTGCAFDRAPAVERNALLWGLPAGQTLPFHGGHLGELIGLPLGGGVLAGGAGGAGALAGGAGALAGGAGALAGGGGLAVGGGAVGSGGPVGGGEVVAQPPPEPGTESARAVAVDRDGNTVVTGYFDQTMRIGGVQLTAEAGQNNLFVAKLAPDGTVRWARTFESDGLEAGLAIGVDSRNRISFTGYFTKMVRIGRQLKSAGGMEVFVAQLDENGEPLWARNFAVAPEPATVPASSLGYGLAVDRKDNILVTGPFSGSINFGKGKHTAVGSMDVFVAKFGPTGETLWSRSYGSESLDYSRGIATDFEGNIVIVGQFTGTVRFGKFPLKATNIDLFVAKLAEEDGDVTWARSFPGGGVDVGTAVAADAKGFIFVTGQFNQSMDFGGGPLTSTGVDLFVVKFDPDGKHQWSRNFNGTLTDTGTDITVDSRASVVVTGVFSGSIDFGGGLLTASGDSAAFVLKLDGNGRYVTAQSFVSSESVTAYGVAVDRSDQIAVVGEYTGLADFGAGPAPASGQDLFIVKLAFPAALEALARIRPPTAGATTLLWTANRMAGLQTVLALDTNQVQGVIRDNDIAGTVSLFDVLKAALFRGNTAVFNAGGVPNFNAQGIVRFECNRVDQIVTRYDPAKLAAPEAFHSLSLTDNTFRGRENSLIGTTITATGNHFAALPAASGYSAVAICRFPIFVGNQAVDPGRIEVAAVEDPQVAANAPRLTIARIY